MYISQLPDDSSKAKEVIKKYARLKSERNNWDSYWETLAQYIIPQKDDVYGYPTVGEDKHNRLYDGTSIHANELLASALHSMLTNPSSIWFDFATGDKDIDGNKEARQWMQDAVKRMIRVMNNSNFQTEIHEVYLDLGGIGTAPMRIEEDEETVVRFFARPIYEHYIEENNKGIVDTVYREYEFSLRQLVQEFGEDSLIDFDLRQSYQKDDTRKVTIVHGVEPIYGDKNGRFASYHVLKDKAYLLREGKFNSNPYAVPRWTKISGEKYGRCPGMKALPDIKMLNKMMQTMIRAAQKAADPPMMVPDNGFLLPLKMTPGGTNIYRAGSKDKIEYLQSAARMEINHEMVEQARMRIRQAFFIDQLQLQDGPQMTATEVMQRTEEKLRTMGPILGRLNTELLRPIVDRVFDIMLRRGLFAPMPEALKGKNLDIVYVSQISKAQRASEADTLTRVIQSVAPVAQMAPQMFDNLNSDMVLRYHAHIFGLAEDMLNDPEEVSKVREARAQQEQAMVQAQQENVQADTEQKLANSQPR
jgi:hypothetical protein